MLLDHTHIDTLMCARRYIRYIHLKTHIYIHREPTNSCSSSQGRAICISLHFVNLSCLCSSVSGTCQAPSHSLLHCSLSFLPCDGFGTLLEVFRVSMFTTSSKTTWNWILNKKATIKVSRWAHAVRSHAYCPLADIHDAPIRVQWTHVW